jgi:hypothetical protein
VATQIRRRRRSAVIAAEDKLIRLELSDPERTSLMSGLALGLGLAALVGAVGVAIYFAFRRRNEGTQGLAGPAASSQPIVYMLPSSSSGEIVSRAPVPAVSPVTAAAAAPVDDRVYTKTYLLPPMTATQIGPVRVAQAMDNPITVVVQVTNETAKSAVFSKDMSALARPSVAGIPAGGTFSILAGHSSEVRLAPRQALYAKGSTTGLLVTVSEAL